MFHRFLNTPLYTGISAQTITIFVKNYTLHVNLSSEYTAQKMKFSVKISSVNVTKSKVSCGIDFIYWSNL